MVENGNADINFENQITKNLKNASSEQICQFAWLCGVRALPFLSVKKGFAYWPKNDRQKYLYSIFYALDLNAQAVFPDDFGVPASAVARDVNAVMDVTYSAVNAIKAIDLITTNAARNAVYATYCATTTAYAATTVANRALYAADAAADAACAAYAAYAAYAATSSASSILNFKSILFNDIKAIKENRLNTCNHDTSIYGKLWHNFQEDLKTIGCAYWAQLYEDIFRNGFDKIDKEELKNRLFVPESIRSLGAANVGSYLTGPKGHLNEARIIILGEKGAGKTSLANKLLNPEKELLVNRESTEGVDILSWRLPATECADAMKVRIWDFAGHAITHTAHRFFLSERCVYVIVYDGRTEGRNDIQKWLSHVQNYGGNSPVYILINLRDKNKPRIDENMLLDKFPKNIKDSESFVYLSLLDDTGKVKVFRNTLENLIRKNPIWNNKIPDKWYKVKEILEHRFENTGLELIEIDEFRTIAQDAGIREEDIADMQRSLHALGICLWYDKIINLQNLVLNPNWISYGVYTLINWLGKKDDYKLHINDFDDIFSGNKDAGRYLPPEKRIFLYNLLKHYELAYPLEGSKTSEYPILVLPSMISELQPEKGMEDAYSIRNSLLMRYRVRGIMPIGTIAQFIVRHHEMIKVKNGKQVVWRCGVALQDKKGNEALVVEDGLEIRLSVKGKTAKEFLNALRNTLNGIFEKYRSDFPELEYAIYETTKLIYLSDKTISDFAARRQDYPIGGVMVNTTNVQEQYNINGNGSNVVMDDHSMYFNDSLITNSPVTGIMVNSTQTITVNKPEIEVWLQKVIDELEKNNIRNDDLTSAVETLKAIIQAPNPNGKIIKSAVETIKTIGINIVSSAIWQSLMAHPPI